MKYGYIPLVLFSASVAGNVCAYEPGNWITRAGYASVDPRDDSVARRYRYRCVVAYGIGQRKNDGAYRSVGLHACRGLSVLNYGE